MKIRNRLFPYPVLNNNSSISDYKNGTTFELSFDDSNGVLVDGNLLLKDVCIKSNDECLTNLLKQDKIKGVLIVECSSTVFREKYEISYDTREIKIPINKFNNAIEISAFIYATDDIDVFANNNFVEDYGGLTFRIEKYCIIAADDGYTINVDNQPETENKKSSIFTIVRDVDSVEDLIHYKMAQGTRKINIYLPDKYYGYYNLIKQKDVFLNASFATIAIPVLLECLIAVRETMLNEEKTIEEICFDYPWFRSVCRAYKREKGEALTEDFFKYEVIPMELAQIVFNYTSCNGLNDIYSVIIHDVNSSLDEEEN